MGISVSPVVKDPQDIRSPIICENETRIGDIRTVCFMIPHDWEIGPGSILRVVISPDKKTKDPEDRADLIGVPING